MPIPQQQQALRAGRLGRAGGHDAPLGRWPRRLLAASLGVSLSLTAPTALAAENVVFVSGAFRRSIPVADLELLASSGEARGLLSDALRLTRQDPRKVGKLLNQSMTLPVVLVSRLLNTRIGEVLLQRLSRIIYPLQASDVGLQALRAAVILGIADNNKGLSALSFLRAYPNQELAVSLPALLGLMGKANSITDLVRFFSDSPLDGLRGSAQPLPAPAAGSSQAPAGQSPAEPTKAGQP